MDRSLQTAGPVTFRGHKWLWRFLRRRDWRRFEVCLERLRERDIQFDEVTYNFAMYGLILHPKKDDELAHQVFDEMKDDGRFHPALLRMQQGFLDSYFELKEVDATPNRFNLLKAESPAMMSMMKGKGKGKGGLRSFDQKLKVWIGGLPADNCSIELNKRLKEHMSSAGGLCLYAEVGKSGNAGAAFKTPEEASSCRLTSGRRRSHCRHRHPGCEGRAKQLLRLEQTERLNSGGPQVTRTFWQISVNFKRLRVKETKKRLAAAAEQERERLAASGLLLEEPSVYRDEAADTDGELSDLELGPRVKWPARRPYQMKNVHKGSGVPHRKKHRWKH
eukprot:s2464_g2.t1